jgi:hypothetical protein
MKSIIAIAVFCAMLLCTVGWKSDLRAASVLARADVFRNPIDSFSTTSRSLRSRRAARLTSRASACSEKGATQHRRVHLPADGEGEVSC